ncbi:hypothetical protein [Cnuibacter physcomitrellae]|uniref:hypothetical protein n=1 Tax=Cnuibacter physcomitrellae TaxID=1619308 RepID=UPI0012F4E22E|nr:hypothetical protein [Cnuibacter physcomitrellae]
MPETDRMERVEVAAGRLSAVVEAEGARMASLRWTDPRGGGERELLLRTPWSDDPDGPWSMPVSSHEWHRRYRGGWHVLLPRAGDPVAIDGIEQPFHGEAAWRVWRLATVPGGCDATVLLRTVPLRLERRVRLEGSTVRVIQDVRNEGPEPVAFGWLEHPALDGPLLEGATVRLGDGEPVAVVDAPQTSFADLDGRQGVCRISAPVLGVTIEMRWDGALFPRTHLWQERRGTAGFPWWGGVDAVGVEPSSDRFRPSADQLGSLVVDPGATLSAAFEISVTPGA